MTEHNIPILNLSPEIDTLWDELNTAIQRVLRSGQFILGNEVLAFESKVASYLGVKHAIGVNSGTDALVLAMRALGLGPRDEVITTPFTFIASTECISVVGATPVFVDIDPVTFNLDVTQVEGKITPRTRAILPVHLYGQAADMGDILQVAHKHELKVIEDVAQAFGGEYNGRKLGAFGEISAYSFFPSKTLGAYGDAGLVTTNDDQLADTVRMLRSHGSRKKYYNEVIGYNSRMDALQAAVLQVKLPYVDAWGEQRRKLAQSYSTLLEGVREIVTPTTMHYAYHMFHQYTVRIPNGLRNSVQKQLAESGIGSMVYYPVPVHKLPIYASSKCDLPLAERAAQEVLSLPLWPQMNSDTQQKVVTALKQAVYQAVKS